MNKKIFAMLLLPALLAGCSSITNLTPSKYQRDASGFYRVEAEWKSSRQVIRPESFEPLVVVNFDTYPMRPVALVQDRWEAYSHPAGQGLGVLPLQVRFQGQLHFQAPCRQPDVPRVPELKILEKK